MKTDKKRNCVEGIANKRNECKKLILMDSVTVEINQWKERKRWKYSNLKSMELLLW